MQYKYDKAGNVRFSQDAAQAVAGRVLFTSYDFANRPLTTGEATATFSTLDPNVTQAFESTTGNWLTLDQYDKKPSTGSYPWNIVAFSFDINNFGATNLMGRLAATAERSNGKWLVTLYSYDSRGRVATRKVISEDLSSSLKSTYTYTYNLQDNLTQLQTTVGTNNFYHWYDYDAPGRLWKVFTNTTSSKPPSPEVTYTYTPVGQVCPHPGHSVDRLLLLGHGYLRRFLNPASGSACPHPPLRRPHAPPFADPRPGGPSSLDR